MSRLKKITILIYVGIIASFGFLITCIMFVGLRLEQLENYFLKISFSFALIYFVGAITCLLAFAFFDIPLLRYKNTTIAKVKVNLRDHKPYGDCLKINKHTEIFYKKNLNFRSISIYRIGTLNVEECKMKISDLHDTILNTFSHVTLSRQFNQFWLVDVNVFYYVGNEIDKAEKFLKQFNYDNIYFYNRFVCIYCAKNQTLLIRRFNCKNKNREKLFFAYRMSVKFLCKFYNLNYRKVSSYL